MPLPTSPSLDYSYTAFQQAQGNNTFPGTQLDNDLANLKQSIDQTIDFAASVIREDGQLRNGVVTKEALGPDITLGVEPPRPWAPDRRYEVNDTATINNTLWICTQAHTSSDFADDMAVGFWDKLIEFTVPAAIEDGAVTTEKLAALAVTAAKIAASAVTTAKIADGAVTPAKLAPSVQATMLMVGATMEWDGPVPPAGWVFKAGQELSRVTYSALMNVLTAVCTGTVSGSSQTITNVSADLRGFGLEGAAIEGAGIEPGTTVTAVTSTTITLSQNASASGSGVTLRIFPHGNGNGSTTFNVPDDRGRVAAGRDSMGGTAQMRLTSAGGVAGARLGAAGGSDTHTLTEQQMPPHSHTGVANTAGLHAHTYWDVGGHATSTPGGEGLAARPDGLITRDTAFAGDHWHTLTISAAGGGQAHPNVQPTRVTNKIIFTGVV